MDPTYCPVCEQDAPTSDPCAECRAALETDVALSGLCPCPGCSQGVAIERATLVKEGEYCAECADIVEAHERTTGTRWAS